MKTNLRKTKIIATVGPASSSYEVLLEMVQAGVDVFRLNFSHGSHADHLEVIQRIVYLRNKYNLHISLMADLQGPKLRVGKIEGDGILLKPGQHIIFTQTPCIGTAEKVYMSYENFVKDVKTGETILIDDGKLVLKVVSTNGDDEAVLEVIYGGMLTSNKGVNLPDTKITLPALTTKDLADLEFVLRHPFNWVALSFVRNADDIHDLRERIEGAGHDARIIAKVEKPEAIKNIKDIIKASNAIMVARGDLGVEIPMERLPNIQKEIIQRCLQRARPVIVATQMMESMITNPSPTRAEITDVANAVFDGTDAVMLSGETSVGMHPVKVVEAMNKIIAEAEKNDNIYERKHKVSPKSNTFLSDAICLESVRTAALVDAKAIIGMTASGYTAFKVSSFRPRCNVFVFSENAERLAMMNLVWGVRCFYYNKFTTTDGTIEDVCKILKLQGHVEPGDVIINTGSMPLESRLRTNFLKITEIT